MDLVRRHAGRRVAAHLVRVPGGAIRQRRPADRRATGGKVFIADEVPEFPVRGIEFFLDQDHKLASQPRTLGGRPIGGHVLDGAVEDALLGIGGEQVLELRHDFRHDDARVHDASRHALAHGGDRRIHPDRECLGAADPALVVVGVFEGLRPGAITVRRQFHREAAVELVDRQQAAGEPEALDLALAVVDEHLAREPLLVVEGCRDRSRARCRGNGARARGFATRRGATA